jgi:hypothetical protein
MIFRIELDQEREALPGPEYRVRNTVTDSENIEPEIFVFETSTDEYMYVADVGDMSKYPPSKQEAEDSGSLRYRKSEVIKEYPQLIVAQEFAVYTRNRVEKLLLSTYALAVEDFVGEDTYVYEKGTIP